MANLSLNERETHVHDFACHKHSFCWGPIIAGSLAAISVSIILFVLGSGIGLAAVSPRANAGAGAAAFGIGTAAWLIITQWASSGIGGYITGRFRKHAYGVHTDEVFFRDTAHGFITWALATVITVTVVASGLSAIVSGGAKAGSAVVAAGAAGAGHEGVKNMKDNDNDGYLVDTLFRSDNDKANPAQSHEQVGRILAKDVADGKISDGDKNYLVNTVSKETGLSNQDASARVNDVLSQIDNAKEQAKEAAEKAKKTASMAAILTALSMIIGAFVASVAATLGGIQRDKHDTDSVTTD